MEGGGGYGVLGLTQINTCRNLFLFFSTVSQQPLNFFWQTFTAELSVVLFYFLTVVCRWFRFAQLAKGKKFRP
jgi:hypothetical protein